MFDHGTLSKIKYSLGTYILNKVFGMNVTDFSKIGNEKPL